jgi:hypothetical protein
VNTTYTLLAVLMAGSVASEVALAQGPGGSQREQVLALFESDHVDTAQLQALDEQDEQPHETVGNAIRQAIVEVHDTPTPEPPKIVADDVRAHTPGGPGGPHRARAACWGPNITRSMRAPMAAPVIVNAVSTELPDGVVMVFSTLIPPITIVWVLDPVAEQVAIRGGEGPGKRASTPTPMRSITLDTLDRNPAAL